MEVVTKVNVKIIFKSGHVHDFKTNMKGEPNVTRKEKLGGMLHFSKMMCGNEKNKAVDTVWAEIDDSSVMCLNTQEVVFVSIELDE